VYVPAVPGPLTLTLSPRTGRGDHERPER